MEAGRELDALVAEKVMGWAARGAHPIFRSFPVYATGTSDTLLPRFSTDIAAAWTVVAKMREHGFLFSAIQFETPDWEIEFHAKSDPLLPGMGTVATGRTAEFAICKAALSALAKRDLGPEIPKQSGVIVSEVANLDE